MMAAAEDRPRGRPPGLPFPKSAQDARRPWLLYWKGAEHARERTRLRCQNMADGRARGCPWLGGEIVVFNERTGELWRRRRGAWFKEG